MIELYRHGWEFGVVVSGYLFSRAWHSVWGLKMQGGVLNLCITACIEACIKHEA